MNDLNRALTFYIFKVPNHPMSPTFGSPSQPSKTFNMGGTQKQIVSHQFNSPLNLYSEEALADSAITNQNVVQSK